ncbi:MAG: hypothetical protein IJT30_10530 [Muribaculaceae bacterium]|nr:hypothetical protein [Muribaculaceae bacterium]
MKIVILVLLVGLLAAGIVWARARAGRVLCQRVDVQIVNTDSTQFVTEEGLMTKLSDDGLNPVGKPMSKIDASRIEKVLGGSEYLERVECVKGRDGVLVIRASQLVPVLRVFDGGNESYYVNAAGKTMTATSTFYADVPVVQGHFTAAYPATRLLPMVNYVEHDTLLRSLVSMYTVRDSNNIFITPTIVGHVVNMGPVDGYAAKFEKLKLFYREVMPAKGWETYDTISVKWSHQVVATKRKKAVRQVMEYNPNEDELPPDMETMAVGDTTTKPAKDEPKSKKDEKKAGKGDNAPEPQPKKGRKP